MGFKHGKNHLLWITMDHCWRISLILPAQKKPGRQGRWILGGQKDHGIVLLQQPSAPLKKWRPGDPVFLGAIETYHLKGNLQMRTRTGSEVILGGAVRVITC